MIPEITIGFPVYNVEKYVEKSLLSALEQDFQLPYEILVIDDCGTDNSMAIVLHLQATHSKGEIIRIIRHDENKGLGEARNTAIKHAKGKYLLFLDSDDWLTFNALSLLYRAAERYNTEITIGSTLKVYANSNQEEAFIYPEFFIDHPSAGVFLNVQKCVTPLVSYWNKLFLLDFIKDSNMYCVHRIMEDVIPDFRAKALSNRIMTIPDVTLFYNERSGSIMDTLSVDENKMRQTAHVTIDIIERIKYMIKNEFQEVDGIYDIYFANLMRYFFLYKQLGIDNIKYPEIEIIEHNAMNFIPSLKVLHGRNARLMYLLLKNRDHDIDQFFKAYQFASSRIGRVLKLLISL